MASFPHTTPTFQDLPKDPEQRRETLLDILGQQICWTRDLAIARLRTRTVSHSPSDESDEDKRVVYEQVGRRSAEDQDLAFRFAEVAIDVFMKHLLALFANIGTDLKQDENHVIWYKLVAEIYDIHADEIIEECALNRNQLEFLPDYLSQWLQRHREKKSGDEEKPKGTS